MKLDAPPLTQHPLVAELVGLAGVGKTTLLQTLCSLDRTLQSGVTLHPIQQAPVWLSHGFRWLPTFLHPARQSRWFTPAELRSMVYLQAWHSVLTQHARLTPTILDHGPLFRLALLREFGPSLTREPQFTAWWTEMLDRWAETLDVVIVLDAPDDVLLERIQIRDRRHSIKNQPQQAGYEFLRRYRAGYEQILAELRDRKTVHLLQFDSHENSPEQMAEQILNTIAAIR